MKVRIETVGDYYSGLGHLTRMRVLASEIEERFGFNVNLVKSSAPYDDEDLVIVDVDVESAAFYLVSSIRSNLPNAKVVLFKNGRRWAQTFGVADLVIQPTYDNIIIDRIFRDFTREQLNKEVRDVFINQGGSDPWGIAPRILHVMEYLPQHYRFYVVVGRATHNLTVQQLLYFSRCAINTKVWFYYDIPPRLMYRRMVGSDLAITAPGQTFAELSAMSVPSIIIGHHERHDMVGRELHEMNAAKYLGVGPNMQDAEFLNKIALALEDMDSHSTRNNYVKNAQRVINKHGVDRIVDMIEEIL